MNKSDLLKTGERLDDLQFNNLFIIQNPNLYCFTSDAVILANLVKIKRNETLVDLCSGSGVIGILAQAKTNAKKALLVEVQNSLADMCARSIKLNGIKNVEVINQKLQGVNKLIGNNFDCVVCNPPYKVAAGGKISEKSEIAICKHEILITLEEIVREASNLLKFGGKFYIVNKEERLTDLMYYFRIYKIEPKVLTIRKSNSGANIIFLEGKKGGKSGLKIRFI